VDILLVPWFLFPEPKNTSHAFAVQIRRHRLG
jgi:hypothetical protein